jgi:hypothetical protein
MEWDAYTHNDLIFWYLSHIPQPYYLALELQPIFDCARPKSSLDSAGERPLLLKFADLNEF